MAERLNGNEPFARRTHGSSRRGVFPVPANNLTSRLEQSRGDKARIIEMLRQRNAERLGRAESDLGNKELPAYKHKQEILTNVEAYKAIILGGATGSGKSTQLPQYLFEAGYDMTVMLVPRRVIADGLGERIREEMAGQIDDFDAEETVGIVHGERSERHDNNKILVMTPNTFIKMEQDLQKNFGDKKLAIVADEIHEANLFTEIAAGVAAMSVREHDDWRLIAASATHNADTLQKPFQKLNNGTFVPEIMIEGRPFDIEIKEEPSMNPMEVYAEFGHDHEKAMIFTSGKREIDHIIEETSYAMDKLNPGSSEKIVFRKLHGELSEFELSHIDDPIPPEYRLVIVSSPAGMSGITIPGVTMVISDGTINRQELDEDGVPGLKRDQLTKSEVTQQAGRAGRDVSGGIAYIAKPTAIIDDILRQRGQSVEVPQMEFVEFENRKQHAPPEIYSTNLSRVVLSTARLGYPFAGLNEFIPHPVKSPAIVAAEEALSRLGALDEDDKITTIGKFMDDFPVSPELSRGLFEVRKRAGTLQQLARAACIASALNEGGLQDFTEKDNTEWKKLIRPSTANDYIAQLDIMIALEQQKHGETPLFEFVDTYDLSPKRVERAQKGARKMLQSLKISPDTLLLTFPTGAEEKDLMDDFTAGLIDQVYREAGIVNRKKVYRNIHGDSESKRRNLSNRSVTVAAPDALIGGSARWYEVQNKRDKVWQRFDIIELTMPVDPVVLGRYALESNLLTGRSVAPRIDGDRVVEREQRMFGSISVGSTVPTGPKEVISYDAQNLLVQRVLEAPGEAQRALRELADELEMYRQRTPNEVLQLLMKPDAPKDITKQDIKERIQEFAKTTRDGREIDLQLRHYLYSQNVTIDRYFDDAALAELRIISPDTTIIAGEETRVFYENGQPYVTNLHKRQLAQVTKQMYLADGREVLKQVPVVGGGTERISVNL